MRNTYRYLYAKHRAFDRNHRPKHDMHWFTIDGLLAIKPLPSSNALGVGMETEMEKKQLEADLVELARPMHTGANARLENGMRPVHPAEILREDFLVPFGMSANALAQRLHVPTSRVNGGV